MFSNINIIPPEWEIGLSAWIIQDGNYGNFEAGKTAKFALEFYSQIFQPSDAKMKSAKFLGDAQYQICGEIIYLTKNVWVLDFGILAFHEDQPPVGLKLGDYVTAIIYLGIDPFFYFESLYALPGMPPLIYLWEINLIGQQTSPFIESTDASSQKTLIRDPNKLDYKTINKTDAWKDDDGNAEYVLRCTQAAVAPKPSRS